MPTGRMNAPSRNCRDALIPTAPGPCVRLILPASAAGRCIVDLETATGGPDMADRSGLLILVGAATPPGRLAGALVAPTSVYLTSGDFRDGQLASETARGDLAALSETLITLSARIDPASLGPLPLAAKFT